VTWQEDIALRDLEDDVLIEATCMRCLHTWLQSPMQLLLKVLHRDVKLDEVASNLACPKRDCRHVGTRVTLIRNEETSGFVGGMP
jgi:GR25 family glycosyltransferase involved in LPS biosynthesis